jgi:D-sedoheptulose 7-phosphate isomerase
VYGKKGDVLWGISTSGNSRNIINAMQVAKAYGLTTIALTGGKDCDMDSCADIILKAPATETFEIQEFHLPIYHAICLMVEEELFGDTPMEAP